MGIDTKRVLIGGVAAGVVIFLLDAVANGIVLGDSWTREMSALSPAVAEAAESRAAMVSFFAVDVLLGILLVWLYAAIRPRFGPGPRTAVVAALFFWIYASIMWAGFSVLGFFSWRMYGAAAVAGIVMLIPGALVGAALYKEGTAAGTGPGLGVPGGTLNPPQPGVKV